MRSPWANIYYIINPMAMNLETRPKKLPSKLLATRLSHQNIVKKCHEVTQTAQVQPHNSTFIIVNTKPHHHHNKYHIHIYQYTGQKFHNIEKNHSRCI